MSRQRGEGRRRLAALEAEVAELRRLATPAVLADAIAAATAAAVTGQDPRESDLGAIPFAECMITDAKLDKIQDREFATVPPSDHPEWMADELDADGVAVLRDLEAELHYRREHLAITDGGQS